MKCGGLEPRTHDVMKELARVHLYIWKFQTRPHPTASDGPAPGAKGSKAAAATTAPAAAGKGGKRARGNRGHGKRH